MTDPEAASLRGPSVLPARRLRRWRRASPTFPTPLSNTVRIAERCNVTLVEGENYLPNFDVPAGFTLDAYFDHVVRNGFNERLPRLKQLAASGMLRHTVDEYERRPLTKST